MTLLASQRRMDGSADTVVSPPWAWIRCIRALTDRKQQDCYNESNSVDLPVEILPWLFLSDRTSAMNMTKLKDRGMTHILSVHAADLREDRYYHNRLEDTGIVHKRIQCEDVEGYDMIGQHWDECLAFLTTVRDQHNVAATIHSDGEGPPPSRVVVHCVAGINRSGLIACAAYMVLERKLLIPTVQYCLRQRGGSLLWNRSFQDQLCHLAQRENLLGPHPNSGEYGSNVTHYYSDEPLAESEDNHPLSRPAHEVLGITATSPFFG